MTKLPQIYDVKTDSLRDVTQADVDFFGSVSLTTGLMRSAIFAIMRLQILLPNGLVDRGEVIAAIRRLEALALMPEPLTAGKSKHLYFEEGELAALREKEGL